MRISIILVCISLCCFSCKKESNTYSTTSARDHAIAELNFEDVIKVVDAVSKDTEGVRADFFDCIETLTVDTVSTPKTVTVNFGQSTCTDDNGVRRQGLITITYTDRYLQEGAMMHVELDGYKIDGFSVIGNLDLVNLGINQNENMAFTVQVNGGKVKAPLNDYEIVWSATQYREWVEGNGSPWLVDDEYAITGTSEGTNREGKVFATNIRSALRSIYVCPWMVKGTTTISEEGPEREINYGSGTCDDQITVTANGQVSEINI